MKLPPAWDDKTVDEAVVQPFVEAYDKAHPDTPASAYAPFTRIKVRVWSGPTPCASDHFRDPEREGVEDIKEAEKPIYNPLNLPLGWDGKPIPYWLYKLHGLNLEFKCDTYKSQVHNLQVTSHKLQVTSCTGSTSSSSATAPAQLAHL